MRHNLNSEYTNSLSPRLRNDCPTDFTQEILFPNLGVLIRLTIARGFFCAPGHRTLELEVGINDCAAKTEAPALLRWMHPYGLVCESSWRVRRAL